MTITTDAPVRPAADSTPLWDLGAERVALGAMLLDGSIIPTIEQILPSPKAFYDGVHQIIYDAILGMRRAGKPVETFALGAHLAEAGDLNKVGGAPYLHTLINEVPIGVQGPHYAGIVAERAVLRDLDGIMQATRQRIRDGGDGSSAELIEQTRLRIGDLAGRLMSTGGPVQWCDIIAPALSELEELQDQVKDGGTPSGIPTDFTDLNKLIKGLEQDRVYVVAGQSGSGKSTFVGDLVRSTAFRHGKSTLVFNLEMSRHELFNKLVCAEAGVDHQRLTRGGMTDDDWMRIARTAGDTADAPLWIDDTPDLTMADIRVRAYRAKQENDLSVLVVDLIGLVSTSGLQAFNREQQIAQLSRGLKVLAKELHIAVIIVAQINRGPQQRADKRPTMHDLRESAAIGHDADVVILVHRDEQHDPLMRRGEADLIVDKNRSGPTGTVVVAAQLHLSRFMSIAIEN